MSILRKLPRLILAAASLSILAGCVSTTVATDPLKLPQQSNLKPVMVSVTANTGEIAGFDRITVQRLSEAQLRGEGGIIDNYVLQLVAPGLSRDTSFFSGALPTGEYRFASFSDSKTQKILHIPANARLLGNFVVSGAKPVDLGRLVVTPMNTNVVYGRGMSATSNRQLLQRFAPQYAALLAGEVEGGWKPAAADALPADSVESYAKGRPVGAFCVNELADGRIVAASRLGSILVRSPAGRWKVLRGPGIESLLCVTPTSEPGAELVAMGEFGTLLRKPAGADQLVPVDTGNLPPGNILRLYGDAKNGWFLALQRSEDITIFQSPRLEAGDWTPVRKESIAASLWHGGSTFFIWPTAEGFGYAVSAGPVHLYNMQTKTWTERATPKNQRLIAVTDAPTGTLFALTSPGGGFGGAFATVFMSKDQAQSWHEMQVPYTVKAYAPTQAVDGTVLMPGGVFSNPELQGSKDDGRTWSHFTKYELGRTIIPLRSGSLIDYDHGQWGLFTLRHSADGGKNWQVEYSNFDRRAYEASQSK